MTPADAPHWADQLSAWSTFATAVLALAAAIGAIGTLIVAMKTFKSQNAVFAEQIKQLQEDREQRQQQQREQDEQRQRQQLNIARQVTVKVGAIEPYEDELVSLIGLINQSEEGRGAGTYPAAFVAVHNRSAFPISSVESTFGDTVARYCWVEETHRMEVWPVLHYLASGARAFFVHTGISEDNVPHLGCEVTFVDDDGQCWKTDAAGKTQRINA